jgi:uncharacterized protein YndB with AHSA1/START domain
MDRGTYIEHDGRPAVRFQRTYPHAIERVWSAVTEPDELAHWFPSTVRIELRPEGRSSSSVIPTPGRRLARSWPSTRPVTFSFTWFSDELHFELEPVGDNSCKLTLINVLEAPDAAARNAAGWSVCLAELDKHVSGAGAGGPHSDTAEPWRPHYDAYVTAGMPSGAKIHGEAEQSGSTLNT